MTRPHSSRRPATRANIHADKPVIPIGTVSAMTAIGDPRPAFVTCCHCGQRYSADLAPHYLCGGCSTLHEAKEVEVQCSRCGHVVPLVPEWIE